MEEDFGNEREDVKRRDAARARRKAKLGEQQRVHGDKRQADEFADIDWMYDDEVRNGDIEDFDQPERMSHGSSFHSSQDSDLVSSYADLDEEA